MVRKTFTQNVFNGSKGETRLQETDYEKYFDVYLFIGCLRYHLFPTKSCAPSFTLNFSTNSYVATRFFALEAEHSYLFRDLIGSFSLSWLDWITVCFIIHSSETALLRALIRRPIYLHYPGNWRQQIKPQSQLRKQRWNPVLFPAIESQLAPCNMTGCGCLDICGDTKSNCLSEDQAFSTLEFTLTPRVRNHAQ